MLKLIKKPYILILLLFMLIISLFIGTLAAIVVHDKAKYRERYRTVFETNMAPFETVAELIKEAGHPEESDISANLYYEYDPNIPGQLKSLGGEKVIYLDDALIQDIKSVKDLLPYGLFDIVYDKDGRVIFRSGMNMKNVIYSEEKLSKPDFYEIVASGRMRLTYFSLADNWYYAAYHVR